MQLKILNKSRFSSINFDNLKFGKIFSDHMFVSQYIDGIWRDSKILPYGPIDMMPGTQVLHYGQSVFEGMKAFKNQNDDLLVFRQEENFRRLNQSAKRLSIPEIPKEIFFEGLNQLLSIDSDWCIKKEGYSLYIRPFIFASGEGIKASSSDRFTFLIITSPSGQYYNDPLNLIIEEKYTRSARGGVGFTKAAGNYAASFYPTKLANKKGYNQVIWTDAIDHKYIEEAGTMNIWFRIKDTLITPEISDSILSGITRDSILTLSKENNYNIEERKISVDEIIESYRNGDLIEVFGTGTAVAVSPIESITVKDSLLKIPKLKDSFALNLKSQLQSIQNGSLKDKYGWTFKIKKK